MDNNIDLRRYQSEGDKLLRSFIGDNAFAEVAAIVEGQRVLIDDFTTVDPSDAANILGIIPRTAEKRRNTDDVANTPIYKKIKAEEEIAVSPWEMRRLNTELSDSRACIAQLEQQIKRMEVLRKESEIMHEGRISDLSAKLEAEREKVQSMEQHMKEVRERGKKQVELVNEENSRLADEIMRYKEKMVLLQTETSKLKFQLNENRTDMQSSLEREKQKTKHLEERVTALEHHLESKCAEKHKVNEQLQERTKQLYEMEKKVVELSATLEDVSGNLRSMENYREVNAYVWKGGDKLVKYHEMEKSVVTLKEENERLRFIADNSLELERTVSNLQDQLADIKKLEKDVAALKEENQFLKLELLKWESLALRFCHNNGDDLENAPDVVAFEKYLDENYEKNMMLSLDRKDLELKNEKLLEKCEQLQKEIRQLQENVDSVTVACNNYKCREELLKKHLRLTTLERNDLRNLLDSYRTETTGAFPSDASAVETVQKVINSYKQRMDLIEKELLEEGDGSKMMGYKDMTEMEVNEAELQEEIEQLKEQLNYYIQKIGYDPRDTKIVHMKLNPTSLAVQKYEDELSKSKKETEILRERVRLLEEGQIQDITRTVEERVQENSSREIEELRNEIESQKIQKDRLVEVFKKRSHDYRDAIYLLFGYKVDSLPNNRYRLLSCFAEDADDTLLFQISQSSTGTMKMIETRFSSSLGDLINVYLKQQNSIPLFLCALTMELSKRQTVVSTSVIGSIAEENDSD